MPRLRAFANNSLSLLGALLRHPKNVLGRHSHNCQIHTFRYVQNGWVGTDRTHRIRVGVHRIHNPGKAFPHDVVEYLRSYGSPLAGSPYHRYPTRVKEGPYRRRRRHSFSLVGFFFRSCCRFDGKDNVVSPVLNPALHPETTAFEDLHHLLVPSRHLRLECADAVVSGHRCQTIQEVSRYPTALMAVVNDEEHLCPVGDAQTGISPDGDRLLIRGLSQCSHQGEDALAVDVGEAVHVSLRHVGGVLVETKRCRR
jgi:hypothetical protein